MLKEIKKDINNLKPSFLSSYIEAVREERRLNISRSEIMKLRKIRHKVSFNYKNKKMSDYTEEEKDYYTNLGCEINKNKK